MTMWKQVLLFVVCGMSLPAHAGDDPGDEAVGQWLRDITMEAAARDSWESGHGTDPHTITPLADMPAPPAVKAHFQRQIAAANAGTVDVAAGRIPAVASLLRATPGRVLTSEVLRKRLPAPPSRLEGTPLANARLLDMDLQGTHMGSKATGLTRTFLLDGVGVIQFGENSYRLDGTRILEIREALNTPIGAVRGALRSQRSADGHGAATLTWVTPEKAFSLSLVTDDGASIENGIALLIRIARAIQP